MRAKRDMSRAEFHKALAARGWRQVLLWIVFDEDGQRCRRGGIGMVMLKGRRGWQINRRASLAKAIHEAERL